MGRFSQRLMARQRLGPQVGRVRLVSVQLWQRSMIGLARSDRLRTWACFVGGESAQAAVATARRLRDNHGITASLFYLGEYLEDPELICRHFAFRLHRA